MTLLPPLLLASTALSLAAAVFAGVLYYRRRLPARWAQLAALAMALAAIVAPFVLAVPLVSRTRALATSAGELRGEVDTRIWAFVDQLHVLTWLVVMLLLALPLAALAAALAWVARDRPAGQRRRPPVVSAALIVAPLVIALRFVAPIQRGFDAAWATMGHENHLTVEAFTALWADARLGGLLIVVLAAAATIVLVRRARILARRGAAVDNVALAGATALLVVGAAAALLVLPELRDAGRPLPLAPWADLTGFAPPRVEVPRSTACPLPPEDIAAYNLVWTPSQTRLEREVVTLDHVLLPSPSRSEARAVVVQAAASAPMASLTPWLLAARGSGTAVAIMTASRVRLATHSLGTRDLVRPCYFDVTHLLTELRLADFRTWGDFARTVETRAP